MARGWSQEGDGGSHQSSTEPRDDDDLPEVQSPLKATTTDPEDKRGEGMSSRRLDMDVEYDSRLRKRKSKGAAQQLDLNIPAAGSHAIVPAGLVNTRVNQLDGDSHSSGGSQLVTIKKQRRGSNTHNARSATAANRSPRRAQ